ncbi:MAG: DUF1707 domain-containing protein [Gordonia sp. (in: high G+C Gram-positive bacteria)]|uniref:DUF1707 SHOCT-like domain-containing protein n=1 Tax=Gordonia TaxID=2053 RepID=UPI0032678F16
MESSDDEVRVGNPERERAIGLINDAFSQGYLDIVEFEERSGLVYQARTRGALRQVVADLPNGSLLFPATPAAAPGGPSAPAAYSPPESVTADWDTQRRKGAWTVPARMVLSGEMGTFDLDYRSATFTAPLVELQLQVNASTVRLRLGPDHEIRYDTLDKTKWSTLKDKAGTPARPGGPVVQVTGSLASMSTLTIKRA